MNNFEREYDSLRDVHTIKFEHGYISLATINEDDEDRRPCFRISHVEVVESQRGKGYGTALYVEAARLAKELGFAGVAFDDEASEEAQNVWPRVLKQPGISETWEADYAGIGGFELN